MCPDGKPGVIQSKQQVCKHRERYTEYWVKRADGTVIAYRRNDLRKMKTYKPPKGLQQ